MTTFRRPTLSTAGGRPFLLEMLEYPGPEHDDEFAMKMNHCRPTIDQLDVVDEWKQPVRPYHLLSVREGAIESSRQVALLSRTLHDRINWGVRPVVAIPCCHSIRELILGLMGAIEDGSDRSVWTRKLSQFYLDFVCGSSREASLLQRVRGVIQKIDRMVSLSEPDRIGKPDFLDPLRDKLTVVAEGLFVPVLAASLSARGLPVLAVSPRVLLVSEQVGAIRRLDRFGTQCSIRSYFHSMTEVPLIPVSLATSRNGRVGMTSPDEADLVLSLLTDGLGVDQVEWWSA